MAVVTDFTKTGPAIILDLLNGSQDPVTTLIAADVTIGAPTAGAGLVTTVAVTGVPLEGFTNSVTITYNRVDLTTMLGEQNPTFEITDEENVADLIAAINARYTINLTTDDYTDAALPSVTEGSATPLAIAAKAGSLIFHGTLTLSLVVPAVDLATVITTTTLDGLDYVPA